MKTKTIKLLCFLTSIVFGAVFLVYLKIAQPSRSEIECIEKGGGVEYYPNGDFKGCVFQMHDGRKECTDSSQCEGACVIVLMSDIDYNADVVGNCSSQMGGGSLEGTYIVEDGKVKKDSFHLFAD